MKNSDIYFLLFGKYIIYVFRKYLNKYINWYGRWDRYVVNDITIVHDCAPGWKEKATQNQLKQTFGVNNFIHAQDNNESVISRH